MPASPPPPPPPPPPGPPPSFNSSSNSKPAPPPSTADRSGLLNDIGSFNSGRLKKVQTKDRSAPMIGGSSDREAGSRGGIGGALSAGKPAGVPPGPPVNIPRMPGLPSQSDIAAKRQQLGQALQFPNSSGNTRPILNTTAQNNVSRNMIGSNAPADSNAANPAVRNIPISLSVEQNGNQNSPVVTQNRVNVSFSPAPNIPPRDTPHVDSNLTNSKPVTPTRVPQQNGFSLANEQNLNNPPRSNSPQTPKQNFAVTRTFTQSSSTRLEDPPTAPPSKPPPPPPRNPINGSKTLRPVPPAPSDFTEPHISDHRFEQSQSAALEYDYEFERRFSFTPIERLPPPKPWQPVTSK